MARGRKAQRAAEPKTPGSSRDTDAAFLAWLADGGARLDDGLSLAAGPDGRRGVFATQALPEGRLVVSVPAAMILAPDESAVAEPLRAVGLGPDEFESPRLEREALVSVPEWLTLLLGTRTWD